MYRIVFDVEKAHWVVELCKFHCFWKRVKGQEFETLKAAETYCAQVGLDAAYKRQPTLFLHSDSLEYRVR